MNEHNNPAPSDPPGKQLPRLYSLNSIGFSTFFGSMLAGFFLLAANYHALGMKRHATLAIAGGLITFSLYSLAVVDWLGPDSRNLAVSQSGVVQINMTRYLLLTIGQVLFLLLITHFFQGSMLSTFKEELRGNYHSLTRSILVGLVASIALSLICMLILTVLGLMPLDTPDGSSA